MPRDIDVPVHIHVIPTISSTHFKSFNILSDLRVI
jgi:hypothetical protein